MPLFGEWFNGDASTSGGFTRRRLIRNPVYFLDQWEGGCGRSRKPYQSILRYFENSPVESLKSLDDSVDGIVHR